MDEEKSFGEQWIDKIPSSPEGDVELTFVRLNPQPKIISKSIPFSYFGKSLSNLKYEMNSCGIIMDLALHFMQIRDYYNFVQALFPDFEVEDNQKKGCGMPDFCLRKDFKKFHIEFKSSTDSIQFPQLMWDYYKSDEEVWFMFIGGLKNRLYNSIKCKPFSCEELIRRRLPEDIMRIYNKTNGEKLK